MKSSLGCAAAAPWLVSRRRGARNVKALLAIGAIVCLSSAVLHLKHGAFAAPPGLPRTPTLSLCNGEGGRPSIRSGGVPHSRHLLTGNHATAVDDPPAKKFWTESDAFKTTFNWLVLAYALTLGLESTDYVGPAFGALVDKIFAVVFYTEIVCRVSDVGAQRFASRRSNWLDSALMLVLGIDAYFLSGTETVFKNVLLLRFARLVRGFLRLSKIFEVLVDAPMWFQRVTGIFFFVALNAELKTQGIQSVVGMLGVFGALLALRSLGGERRATLVYKSLDPAKTFLVKWATLFFVPALVKLPLIQMPPGSQLVRLAILVVFGFFGTLVSTMGVASLFPPPKADQEPSQPVVSSTTAPAEPAYRPRLLGMYLAAMVVGLFYAGMGWVPYLAENCFMLAGTLVGFVGGMLSPALLRKIVHPMFVCVLAVWGSAYVWAMFAGPSSTFQTVVATYSAWPGAGALLTYMLGPAVVALGLLLYERRRMLAGEFVPMLGTSVVSAVISLFGTALAARALSLPGLLGASACLRSISSPFAADLVNVLQASPTFAIAMVVVTGFIGVSAAPPIFGLLKIKCARTRGLAMGASAHGLGTVALAETDKDAFPYSALGFLLVGISTSVIAQIPFVRTALLRIVFA